MLTIQNYCGFLPVRNSWNCVYMAPLHLLVLCLTSRLIITRIAHLMVDSSQDGVSSCAWNRILAKKLEYAFNTSAPKHISEVCKTEIRPSHVQMVVRRIAIEMHKVLEN